MTDRRQDAYAVRLEAAELARSRDHAPHKANGDEQRYAGAKYFMSFTKGLPHDETTGLLKDSKDFVAFRRAIDDGFIDPFSAVAGPNVQEDDFRQWEAPTAGVAFDLEGPDAQAVTMAPAPALLNSDNKANPELIFEMAEVYELAILRDKPFNQFEQGKSDDDIDDTIERLNNLDYIRQGLNGRPRKLDDQKLTVQNIFRGSSPGVEVGPYLSQFLLIGNTDRNGKGSIADGKIAYGVLQIDQKVPIATPKEDYMVTMDKYVATQIGKKPESPENYIAQKDNERAARRFISTPRDLATYVHYDALYEAYLNACLILLGMGTPFDPGFDHLSGVGSGVDRKAGGFALYGGPHILTLVTEVATRALKAVRFQKFNNHIRLRPEALAARIELIRLGNRVSGVPQSLTDDVKEYEQKLNQKHTTKGGKQVSTLSRIAELTAESPEVSEGNYLLPMAFPEGSPMHPAYGAGHATVAGACVTILKAFFDTSAVLVQRTTTDKGTSKTEHKFDRQQSEDKAVWFRAPKLPDPNQESSDMEKYVPMQKDLELDLDNKKFLTLEGELNKLAANISIGRDMAGVHFFSDYYDSLRMGEKIAIGILEEQALTYSTDPFVLSLPTFDGEVVRIGRR